MREEPWVHRSLERTSTGGQERAARSAIAKEFQESSVDKRYWNTISGSPFYQVAQPWMKDYVYQAEFKVLYKSSRCSTRRCGWTSSAGQPAWAGCRTRA
jgi:hypothetical protein